MDRFSQTLWSFGEAKGVDSLIVKAQREALSSQIADLKEELREYESLKAGLFQLDQLKTVAELPTLLIKARIAQGLSPKELAERLGLKEQQIQRYEATDYVSARLARIEEIVGALGIDSSCCTMGESNEY